eukprot:CAMPEP_0170253362 /NCGR_PEP_ID=MMETSP0116_2-20130129/26520_1 /TAXON_ID=400756 /ORGANISM="Durinskia baltica, Strain CSIRO CS-38" /LENGTH=137 /DNA_ID=CAMNT_0010504343 /DNA_START=77 /DNA_END=488 /DNA_ORIENTATION=+
MAKLSSRMLLALALVLCLAMVALGMDSNDSNETTTEMTTQGPTTTEANDTNSTDGGLVGGSPATAAAGVLATLVTLFLADEIAGLTPGRSPLVCARGVADFSSGRKHPNLLLKLPPVLAPAAWSTAQAERTVASQKK